MRLRTFVSPVTLALLTLLTTSVACSKDPEPTTSGPTTVDFGTLVANDGDLQGTGQDNLNAALLAVEQINAAGGVLGKPLTLAVENDKTDVDAARAGYTRLIEKKVAAVIGPSSSSQVIALAELIAASRTLTIGRTSTSPLLNTIADDDFFFRVAPSDLFQAKVLAPLILDAKVERLCMVHREDTYGTRLSEAVTAELTALGSTIPIVKSSFNPKTGQLDSVLSKCDALRCSASDGGAAADCVEDAKIGLLMMTYVSDGAAILRAAPDWSASRQRVFFSDGARDNELVKLGLPPGQLDGAVGTIPSGPDPESAKGDLFEAFRVAYRDKYGTIAPAFSQNAFEAVYVAATAVELAGTTEGGAVRDAVRGANTPGGVVVRAGNWKEIRETIAQKQPIDLRGVTGDANFDANGDLVPPYYYRVWRINDGESKTLSFQEVK